MDYSDIPALRELYLEDSFVLEIVQAPGQLRFELDAVLTPHSLHYHDPYPGEQYCYARGALVFLDVTDVHWIRRSLTPITDADGESDFGNIDSLTYSDGVFAAEGHWGSVWITSSAMPYFVFADDGGGGKARTG